MLLFVGILAGGLLLGLPLFYLGDKYHISALQGIGGMIIFIGVLAARFITEPSARKDKKPADCIEIEPSAYEFISHTEAQTTDA